MKLVISGGGARGFYAIGIIKALEELGLDKKIDEVYGVSIGAIIGAFWTSGYTGKEMFDIFYNLNFSNIYKPKFFKSECLLDNSFFVKLFDKYLKDDFNKLNKKLYVGATNIDKNQFILFQKGNLKEIVLGSMSIPGLFPIVSYDGHCLLDGGISNNFPANFVRDKYKNEKIIGIALNKVDEYMPRNIVTILIKSWEITLESSTIENQKYCDYVFYPELETKIVDIRKKTFINSFDKGYEDGLNYFNN